MKYWQAEVPAVFPGGPTTTFLLPTMQSTALWNIAYQDINTLNGVLQYGATAELA